MSMLKVGDTLPVPSTPFFFEIRDVKTGGMGVVYLCLERQRKQLYAIKSFQEKYLENMSARERFRQECLTWMRLGKHRNVVEAFFVLDIQGQPHIILEYINSGGISDASLRALLQGRPLDIKTFLAISIQFCFGMVYCCDAMPGLVHRDIKPENILLERHSTARRVVEVVKITDFGLAKSLETAVKPVAGTQDIRLPERPSLTAFRGIVGTPHYMSPEQCRGQATDTRSDIYSYGCVMYEIASGRPPFQGTTISQLLTAHQTQAAVPPQAHDGSVRTEVQTIIMKCLAKNPAERYTSFRELLIDLTQLAQDRLGKQFFTDHLVVTLFADDMMNLARGMRSKSPSVDTTIALFGAADPETIHLAAQGSPSQDPTELGLKAVSFLQLGSLQEALDYVDQSIQLDPQQIAAWNLKGLALQDLGRFADALPCYEKSLALSPADIDALRGRVTCLVETGRSAEALTACDQALAHTRDRGEQGPLWSQKGNALAKLQRRQEAIAAYDQALAINPGDSAVLASKGAMLNELGRFAEAETILAKAVALNPQNAVGWANRGNALAGIGRHQEAIQCHRHALDLDPKCVPALIGVGISLFSLRQPKESLSHFERALQIDPKADLAWSNKAVIMSSMGNFDEALRCSDRALELNPSVASTYARGVILYTAQRFQDAVPYFEKAKRMGHPMAAQLIEMCRQRLR